MHNRNNQPRRIFSDMVVQPRPHAKQFVSVDDEQAIEAIYRRQLMRKRIHRVARVAIVATKHNVTARQRRLVLQKQQLLDKLRLLRTNQYRIAATFCLVISVVSVIAPVFTEATDTRPIELDNNVKALIGDSREDTKQYLQYDANRKVYTFEPKQQEKGDYEHTGRNSDAYNLSLSKNADDGITLTDNKSKVDITLKPQFFTASARRSTGDQIVYKSGRTQLIYSLKYNGLKEDIVIPTAHGSTAEYTFKLTLPSGVEARLDDNGNIGIYSGDASLYGDISYGSDEDRAKVEKARENAAKTNLLSTIPFPVIRDSTGKEYTDLATFHLESKTTKIKKTTTGEEKKNEYTLILKAHGLSDLQYPISLDPSITVTSSGDFNKLQKEFNASVDTTNNLIKRMPATGGVLNTWTPNPTGVPTSGYGHPIHIYNGKMYYLDGSSAVQSASINPSDGTVGSFATMGVLPPFAVDYSTALYNGVLYIKNSTTIYYSKIKSDGSLTDFQQGTNFLTTRIASAILAANGYIYKSGGYSQSCTVVCTDTYQSDIEYAKINGDGSVGTWTSAGSNFTTPRSLHRMVYNNGFLYLLGGWDNGTTSPMTTAQYAKVKSDGRLDAWQTATSLTGSRVASAIYIINGYLYVTAGSDSVATSQYAQINTDGSIGQWQITESITNGRGGISSAVDGTRVYVAGGSGNNGASPYADIQYTTPATPGELATETTLADFDSSSNGHWLGTSIAYNGFIYVIGGSTSTSALAYTNVIRKASISVDGSLGTWANTTNSFSKARMKLSAGVFNGNLYIWGGYGACGTLGADGLCNDVQYSAINPTTGDLGGWTTNGVNMATGRAAAAGFIYGNYMYVVGGQTSTGTVADIDYAQISSTGAVGAWQNNPNDILHNSQQHTAVASGGFVYVTGGIPGGATSTIYNDIEYASINASNGQIGVFTSVTGGSAGSWGAGKYQHVSWVYNGYLYYAFGCGINDSSGGCTNRTSDIQYRKINDDGSVTAGNWTINSKMHQLRLGPQAAVYNGNVYFFGGSDSSTIENDTNRMKLNNIGSGSPLSWGTTSNSFTTARAQHASVILNGYIYVIGGVDTSNNAIATVYFAQLKSDSTVLGNWQQTSSLPVGLYRHASATYNGYIYTLGGQSSPLNNQVYYAKPNSDGTIPASGSGAWMLDTGTSFTTARGEAGAVAYNGYLYLVGGRNGGGLNDVQYAPLNGGDGSVGTWQATTSFTTGRRSHATVLYKGFIYILGGCADNTASCTTSGAILNDVQYSQIQPDGTLGAWKVSQSLSMQKWLATSVAYNGYLYSFGGNDSPSVSQLEYAPINANGSIGNWSVQTGIFPSGRQSAAAVASNGRLYLTGGGPSSGAQTTNTLYTGITAAPRIASFTKSYDFETGVAPTKLVTRGSKQADSVTAVAYDSSNNTANSFTSSQVVADTVYNGANSQLLTLGTNRTLARYFVLSYTIDDSMSAVFPDSGKESYITDFDLYYISNPGTRLRGGRTFTNGADRGLDAQPQ